MRRAICTAVIIVSVTAAAGLADRRRAVVSTPTFNREIVRILQSNCQSCHRADGMAPFPLTTYTDTASRAHQIAMMTRTRRMPPWKPAAGCGAFQQERRLTDVEIRMIEAWGTAGLPEGDRRDLPPPAIFAEDWKLGPPDILMAMPEIYAPPSGRDIFRCFVLPSSFHKETLVAAIDFRPRARSAVHHILAYVDESGKAEQLDATDPEPGYECMGGPRFTPTALLGGWFPGSEPAVMPPGVAARVAPEAQIVLQMHYHLHYPGMVDRTELALYLVSQAARTLQFLAGGESKLRDSGGRLVA